MAVAVRDIIASKPTAAPAFDGKRHPVPCKSGFAQLRASGPDSSFTDGNGC
jgi:hypothetical protein